jgi:uncharacterized protein (TIGR03435 family)
MRGVLAVLLLTAQAAASFDVVSIKPADEKASTPIRGTTLRGNRWIGTRVTVLEMIQESRRSEGFDMPDRVIGGSSWLHEDQFDIVATSASTPTRAQLEAMIRAMLADRFHLKSHFEKKTLSAYELTLARRDGAPGPKLHPAGTDCRPQCRVTTAFGPPNHMMSSGVEMDRFAFVLSRVVLDRPVINRTGLQGLFELTLDFAPGPELTAAVASDAPTIFTAVEEQLGLRLKSVRAPLDVLVVDHAEKPSLD